MTTLDVRHDRTARSAHLIPLTSLTAVRLRWPYERWHPRPRPMALPSPRKSRSTMLACDADAGL